MAAGARKWHSMAPIQAKMYDSPSLSSTISKMYLDEETSDVNFVFQNQVRVPAHKSLLAILSDVFRAMFYGELQEQHDITIVDASMSAFKEFLQFFYRNKVELTMKNVSTVVNLVNKYNVVGCLDVCEKFLTNELSSENVCLIYKLATLYNLPKLLSACFQIVNNPRAVFKSAGFSKCERSLISLILQSENLACSEVEVFHACIAWLQAKNKQQPVTRETVQTHLGDLFYEIRFGSMTFVEFATISSSYGHLFTALEYQEIIQMINHRDFQPQVFKKGYRRSFGNHYGYNGAPGIGCVSNNSINQLH